MSQIFKDTEWDDDLPKTKISFQFNKDNKKKKDSAKKNKNETVNNIDEPGKFVKLFKAPQQNGAMTSNTAKKKNKRKIDIEDEPEAPSNTNGKIPAKKIKISKNEIKDDNPKSNKKKQSDSKLEKRNATLLTAKNKALKTDDKNEKSGTGFSAMKNNLQDKLKGSRFRYINELLYTNTGEDAVKLFKDDPTAFNAYHEGYRMQVESWPMNPLDRIIKNFKKIPIDHVVADFGCGDARLAQSIPNKVYSLDLVAQTEDVIECDMANTSLSSDSINVAVYCLSLMGTNLVDFLLEANRVLKMKGLLKIAEVSSRFDPKILKSFNDTIKKCGFELVNQDLTDKLFYFFNFKKVKSCNKSNRDNIAEMSLKPCLYKKR